MDGSDGVCLGLEVLQECQRQDALLRPWSRVQWVRAAVKSWIQLSLLNYLIRSWPTCFVPHCDYSSDLLWVRCWLLYITLTPVPLSVSMFLPLSLSRFLSFIRAHTQRNISPDLQNQITNGCRLLSTIYTEFPPSAFFCYCDIKVRKWRLVFQYSKPYGPGEWNWYTVPLKSEYYLPQTTTTVKSV